MQFEQKVAKNAKMKSKKVRSGRRMND